MRRKKISMMLAASLFVLLTLIGCYCYKVYMDNRVPVPHIGRIMGIPIVENLDFLEGKRQCFTEVNPGVCLAGALLPYTKDGTLYLSQNFAVEEWIGEITVDVGDAFLCTLYDPAWEEKSVSIRDNHMFKLWMVDGETYYELSMAVCGTPVMTIDTQREEEQDLGEYEADPDHFYYDPPVIFYGQIQLFDPGVGTGRYEIMESGVRYYLRGASSKTLAKESYSIGLLDASGKNFDVSLLGMRSDNSWKLKSLAADTSKIREKTACQLWEQFALSNPEVNMDGPRMEYVELIKDHDYAGLYGLIEPVDAKKLNLDANDVLYKITAWNILSDEDIQYSIDHKWRIATFQRIRYPDVITDYEKAWAPLRDYLATFYREAGEERPAESKIYLSNAMDMLFFNMVISGNDNSFKNLYFAADVAEDGSYRIRQIPWDLDLTFGSIYSLEGTLFHEDETVVYEEAAIPFLRDHKPEVVRPYLQERWRTYREGFLSTDNLLQLLRENRDYLFNTGAGARENARWPEYSIVYDIDGILAYQERRMNWLDQYFKEF